MLKYFCKNLFSSFYATKKFMIILVVFTFISSQQLTAARHFGLNVWEYSLFGMSNQYYLTYFLMIAYVFFLFRFIKDESNLIIMRTRRYVSYFFTKLTAVALFTLSFIAMHVAILFIFGFYSLNHNDIFLSSVSTPNFEFYSVAVLFSHHFGEPQIAFISVTLYMFLGLCLISAILMLISHFGSSKATIVVSVVGFICMTVAVHGGIDKTAPLLFVNNYVFLLHALNSGVVGYAIAVAAMIFIFIWGILSGKLLKSVRDILSGLKLFMVLLKPKSIIIMVVSCAVMSLLTFYKLSAYDISVTEFLSLNLWGYGTGYFNIIDFLQLIITNGIALYFISIFMSGEDSFSNSITVRLRHKHIWFKNIQVSSLVLILIQMFVMSVTTAILGLFHTFSHGGQSLNEVYEPPTGNGVGSIFVIGFVLRIVEIMCMQIVMMSVYSFCKNFSAAFFAVMLGYVTVIILPFRYNPFGISSLCRVLNLGFDNAVSFVSIFGIFAVIYAVLFVYMKKSGTRKIFS